MAQLSLANPGVKLLSVCGDLSATDSLLSLHVQRVMQRDRSDSVIGTISCTEAKPGEVMTWLLCDLGSLFCITPLFAYELEIVMLSKNTL